MSDLEPERPLTRRERRMREMVETGAVPTIEAAEQQLREAAENEQNPPAETPVPVDDIEISPVDEQGRPRTRREMRELREQALAARAAAAAPQSAPASDDAETGGAPASEVEAEAPAAEPETPTASEAPSEPEVTAPEEPAKSPEPTDVSLEATQPLSVEELRELQAETTEPAGTEPRVKASEEEEDAAEDEPEASPTAYSFPDITPLDDHVSVFDDPAQRTNPTAPAQPGGNGESGDFDELISRAVAQESATTTTNTSALILPSLPDTGDLSGPLGGTGELFITGSISLPKSLGETGGHVPLSETGEADHLEDLGYDTVPATSNPILPVSASRAVSAVGASGPVVKQETKEKSKLPLVLIVTGGGLVLAVAALIVWGVSSGMFG